MQRERQDFLADLNHAIQINPNDAEAYCQRGLARKNLGVSQEPVWIYSKARLFFYPRVTKQTI